MTRQLFAAALALAAGLALLPGAGGAREPETTLDADAPEPDAEPEPGPEVATPELPRFHVDSAPVAATGRTLEVPAGGDLQDALDRALPGDTVAVAAGATFRGPFLLRDKPDSGWIVVRTGAPDGSLPPPGTRVDPSFAGVMPKLVSGSDAVLGAAPGAHHYRFIGVEIRPEEGRFLFNLVRFGDTATSHADLPHHLVFDRCYIHGDPTLGARRGIALNARYAAVVDSYLSDFKEAGADSQAIAVWNGPGPFAIEGNYLEGAGENLIFGGGDPALRGLVPSDIEIRRNRFTKPLSWRVGDPAYAGTPWTIKNLLELKNARRVLIDGNLFDHNWPGAQNGYAILFTVRNQGGRAPWSVVRDVTFVNNVVRSVASGINILGRDDNHRSRVTRRILIRNNLFDDVGGAWGDGRLFQLLDGTRSVVIEHNTALQTGSILLGGEGAPHLGFVLRDNIAPHNDYGIIGSGTGMGTPSLVRYFPGAEVRGNVIAGGDAALYPSGNFFPRSLDAIGFIDRAAGDYRLAASSPYRGAATDGRDPGADFGAISVARAPAPGARVGAPRGSSGAVKGPDRPLGGAADHRVDDRAAAIEQRRVHE